MSTLLLDARLALRMLSGNRGFAAIAVLAFGLGIGANTAIFSVVHSVLLKPLGYADPERLVVAEHAGPAPVAPATYLDWKSQASSFTQMAAAQAWGGSMRGAARPEPLIGLKVTSNMFSMLGVPAAHGRTFAEGEDRDGAAPVVVIAHSLWQRSFGGTSDVLGRKVEIDGAPYTVVGVMPQRFQFAPMWVTKAEIWTPLQWGERAADRDGQTLRIFARLKPGVPVERARAELTGIMDRLAQQYPDSSAKLGVQVAPLRERVVGSVHSMLLALLGAVSFVLLIACANVANLMLARASGRRREMAVRRALGATQWRLSRQAITEGAVLALCGGALGVALAYCGVRALESVLPAGTMPRQNELGVELVALLFTGGLSVAAGMLAGLFPAWQLRRGDVSETLKEGGRGASEGRQGRALRGALVASEIALAFVLLIGAGLMLRSFAGLLGLDPGFDPANLLSLQVSVSGTRQAEPARRVHYYREVLERMAAVPGVTAVSAVNHAPVTGDVWGTRFRRPDKPEPLPGEWPGAVYRVSWPGYFGAMKTPVLRGREFTERDHMQSQKVVVINEATARRYWPGEDVVGRQLVAADQTWTVVGVVRDVKQGDWQSAPREEIHFSLLQSEHYLQRTARHYEFLNFVVRATGDAGAKASAVRQAIESIDPGVLVSQVTTMDDAVAQNLWRPRLSLLLLGAFGALALVLSVTGIYGVVAHTMSQRTQEIGIRMALGAARGDVIWMAVRQGLAPVAIGIAVGAALAMALTRGMEALLYGVEPADAPTFAGVAALMAAAALFAAFWPARRASRVDPVMALRNE